MWTKFSDAFSGGRRKLQWEEIFIEAPLQDAVRVFEEFLGSDPYNVTCECCGGDYSIYEGVTLEDLTSYERKGEELNKYLLRPDVLVLTAKDIEKFLYPIEEQL